MNKRQRKKHLKKHFCICSIFACGSSWGIGVYETDDETYLSVYGFPPTTMDPNKFSPDYESCTPKEIEAWEKAREAWNRKNK